MLLTTYLYFQALTAGLTSVEFNCGPKSEVTPSKRSAFRMGAGMVLTWVEKMRRTEEVS